jgi:hypothetical protein
MLKLIASLHLNTVNAQRVLESRTAKSAETGATKVWVAFGGLIVIGIAFFALRQPPRQTTFDSMVSTLP